VPQKWGIHSCNFAGHRKESVMTTTQTNKNFAGKFVDDRVGIENKTHTTFVMGYDTNLSGRSLLINKPEEEWTQEDVNFWEMAKKRKSFAVWACKEEHGDKVYKWVKSRTDMKHVTYRSMNSIKKHIGNNIHIHIYTVGDDHPAITGE
tara:strand:- start:76 stop:519 length:444 start_codon:yes stop_codon:yes gene_type:complete